MAEIIKSAVKGLPWYQYLVLLVCAALLVTGFIVPPRGEIHPSVLKGVGFFMLGTWAFNLSVNFPEYMKAGASIRLSHNGTEFEAKGNRN